MGWRFENTMMMNGIGIEIELHTTRLPRAGSTYGNQGSDMNGWFLEFLVGKEPCHSKAMVDEITASTLFLLEMHSVYPS